jgi:hypothetical protein
VDPTTGLDDIEKSKFVDPKTRTWNLSVVQPRSSVAIPIAYGRPVRRKVSLNVWTFDANDRAPDFFVLCTQVGICEVQ